MLTFEQVKTMQQGLNMLKEQGIEAIEDLYLKTTSEGRVIEESYF